MHPHQPGAGWPLAHPFLPAARWSAAPAGRRYLAGWAMATELHVLNDPHMERRAAGDDSREALRGTAERLYAQLVVAANNPDLPPSWTPRRFARYLRWAWLVEGGAQYFAAPGRPLPGRGDPPPARELPALVPALAPRRGDPRRHDLRPARERARPGGLRRARLRASAATAPRQPGAAFDARFRDIEGAWRDYLRNLSERRLESSEAIADLELPDELPSV